MFKEAPRCSKPVKPYRAADNSSGVQPLGQWYQHGGAVAFLSWWPLTGKVEIARAAPKTWDQRLLEKARLGR
jgi:hypothetical protein